MGLLRKKSRGNGLKRVSNQQQVCESSVKLAGKPENQMPSGFPAASV
jgi:hypothetical protein